MPATPTRCWRDCGSTGSTVRSSEVKSRVTRLDPVADAEAYAAAFGELFALEKRRREDLEGGLGG